MATHRGIHWGSQQDLTNGAILADQCKRFIDGKAPLKNPQMGHTVTNTGWPVACTAISARDGSWVFMTIYQTPDPILGGSKHKPGKSGRTLEA